MKLNKTATDYIKHVRADGPSRKVRCGRDNMTARYPSRKMGRVVAVESHSVELAFAYISEHDSTVHEYWPQPPPISLRGSPSQVGGQAAKHTPDFFLLTEAGAGWVECKPAERLVQSAVEQPDRYVRDADGRWRCPAAHAVTEQTGFFYRLWSPEEVAPNLIRNLKFLEDYLDVKYPEPPANTQQAVIELVGCEPGIPLNNLLRHIPGLSLETVYSMIGKRTLYVDMAVAPFSQPDFVRVFLDEVTAIIQLGASLDPSVVVTSRAVACTHPADVPEVIGGTALAGTANEEGEAILRGAREKELIEASLRYRILNGHASADEIRGSWQTHYRWRRAFWSAEKRYGCGLVGLLPRNRFSGRKSSASPEAIVIADQVISEHFFSMKGKSLLATYGVLAMVCEREQVTLPSRGWFQRRIGARMARGECRVREPANPPMISEARLLTLGNTMHGERPWDNTHVDHHLCDIELVCRESSVALGRAWLSVLFDGFSRRVLAFVLSFDRPSYRSVLLLMRECVRRNGRLPDSITVDGGPEFAHPSVEILCARYSVILKRRPANRKGYGALIERFFGTLGTQLIDSLAGSTRPYVGTAWPSVQAVARRNAVWTLEDIHDLLDGFFQNVYDDRFHPSLGDTPRHFYERGLAQSGERQTRQIPYDDSFILMTLPSTRSGLAMIRRGAGITINHIQYWCDEMRHGSLIGKDVLVRFDPWNIAVAWAYLSGSWHRCLSPYVESFQGRTEKELMIASAAILKKNASISRNSVLDAKRLAEFLESSEAEEKLRLQRLKDRAQSRISAEGRSDPDCWFCYSI